MNALVTLCLIINVVGGYRTSSFRRLFLRSPSSTSLGVAATYWNAEDAVPAPLSATTTTAAVATPTTSTPARDQLAPFKTALGDYDGELIDAYYRQRPWDVVARLVEVASPVLQWYLASRAFNRTASFMSEGAREVRRNELAAQLKEGIVQTKSATFIKCGQALSLRKDVIKDPEIIRELTKLQDEVGTFPHDVSMAIIREELGRDPNDIYEFDPPVPIASASIGQVYRATLKATGQRVAVKVQRPDALNTAPLDMYLLRQLARFVRERKKLRSNLVGIVDVFGSQLFKELDYVQEAENCLKFRELYGGIPNIYVPFAYTNLTRTRVLTMEFVDGVKGPWTEGGERMLTIGLQCSVLQLLGTGFFHSDPHRGNLLKSPTGSLVYLDFGMMAQVQENERYALIGAVIGLVNQDIPLVIQNLKTLDFFPPETDENAVVDALTQAVLNATDGGQGSSLNFTKLSRNIDKISTVVPFRLPPFYSFIIRTLSILEGLAVNVDPSFRLIRGAYPFIAKQILESPSEEMTKLLKSVLLNSNGRIRWDKLEELVSITSKANVALESGNLDALKNSKERPITFKQVGARTDTPAAAANVTMDVAMQIMEYLFSERAAFLLQPLIADIADTIDALGLTAHAASSLVTNGLIPGPGEKPDRERVEGFFRLMNTMLSSTAAAGNGGGSGSGNGGDALRLAVLRDLFASLSVAVTQLQPERWARVQPLLAKSQVLVRGVVSRLVERGAVRVVRTVLSPTVTASLPFVGRAFDLAFRQPTTGRPANPSPGPGLRSPRDRR